MGASKWIEQAEGIETNGKNTSAEFVLNLEKREEQLINRIYKLSHILSSDVMAIEEEEQVKLILEDALAELDLLNQQLFGKTKKRCVFH